MLPSCRPNTSPPGPSNLPRSSHRSTNAEARPVNARAQQSNKSNDSTLAANNANNRTNNIQNPAADRDTRAVRPRRRRKKQAPISSRVFVTGYPTYTRPHDLLQVFGQFGSVRVEKCNNIVATLIYPTEVEARKAVAASMRVQIDGHSLWVRHYSAKLKAEFRPQPPQGDFTKTDQKKAIIQPTNIDLTGDFQSQVDRIVKAVCLKQEEVVKIDSVYRDIEQTLQVLWPGCKAIPFGAITTGLGIKTSDADCFISRPAHCVHRSDNCVDEAQELLKQHPHLFTEIVAIPSAKTPIVKFYHIPTDTNCDLSFKTPLGTRNSGLVAFLLHADRRIITMAVIIKYWAKVHELTGTGKLTNYALTMLIIFYLQQPPLSILPSIEWLQRDKAHDVPVDLWNTGFMNDASSLPPITDTSSVLELIGGFFEYYANFNFEEMVVCPFLGTPIEKNAFIDTATLPDEFELYKKNVLNNYVMPIHYRTLFCVQDPFELCNNVACTVKRILALDIKTYFKFAADAYINGNCSGFLKTILIEKPNFERVKPHPHYRFSVAPRTLNTIATADWENLIIQKIKIMFEDMLKIKLVRVENKPKLDTKKYIEKYTGSVTKPIWRRNNLFMSTERGLIEQQSCITEEIINQEAQSVNCHFQLSLNFYHKPKGATIFMQLEEGDVYSFRQLGRCFVKQIQSWLAHLLKPHLTPTVELATSKRKEKEERLKGEKQVATTLPSAKPEAGS